MLKATYFYLVIISVAAGVNGTGWEGCDDEGREALRLIKNLIEIQGPKKTVCSVEVQEQYDVPNQTDKLVRKFLLLGIFGIEVKVGVTEYYYFYAGVKRTTSDGDIKHLCITRIGLSMDPTHQHTKQSIYGTERAQNDNASNAVKALGLNYANEFPCAYTEDWEEDWNSYNGRPEDLNRAGWTRDRFWTIKGTSRVIVTYKSSDPLKIGSWSFATVAISEAGQPEFKYIGKSHDMFSKMEQELSMYLSWTDTLTAHRPWISVEKVVQEFETSSRNFGVFEQAIKIAQKDIPNFTWQDHDTPKLVEAKFLEADWSKFLAVFQSLDEHVVIGAQHNAGDVSLLYVGQPRKGDKYIDICEEVNNYLTLGLDQPFSKTTSYRLWSSTTFTADYFDPLEQQVKLNGPIDIDPRAKIYLQKAGPPKPVVVPNASSVTGETAVYRYLGKFFIVAYTIDTGSSSPHPVVKHIGNAENETDVITSCTTYSEFEFAYQETVFKNRIGTLTADDLWKMLESNKRAIRYEMIQKLASSFPSLSRTDLTLDPDQIKVGFIPSTSCTSRSPPRDGLGYGVIYCVIFKLNATTATSKGGLTIQQKAREKELAQLQDKKFYSLVSIDFITNKWTTVHAGTCDNNINQTKNTVITYLTPQVLKI